MKIRNIDVINKVLAKGRSLFTFRGKIKLYFGHDLDESKSHIFISSDQYWNFLKAQNINIFRAEFVLIEYRRFQVSLRFKDELVHYEMDEKTATFKLICYEDKTIDRSKIHVDYEAVAKEFQQLYLDLSRK